MSKALLHRFSYRRLLLLLALLALLVSLATAGFLVARNHRRTVWLQQILRQADSGLDDYETLRLLNQFLESDPHQEVVYAKIGQIYQRQGEWTKAAAAWQHAASLNATRTDYTKARITALFRSQNYDLLAKALSMQQKKEGLEQSQTVLLALAMLRNGQMEQAAELCDSVTDQEELATPTGKLLNTYLKATTISREELIAELTESTKAEEPAVAFDAMNALAGMALDDNQPEKAESWLLTASQLLPETGEVLLANFYFYRQQLEQAQPLYEKIMQRGINPQLAVRLGEIYASRNDRDAVESLKDSHQLGSKQHLMAGYYLEALLAFMDGDDVKLANSLKYLDNAYQTPVAMLMTLYSALQQNQTAVAVKTLHQVRGSFLSSQIQERLVAITMPYLTQLVRERRFKDAAQLARELRDPQKPALLLEQIILTDQLQRGILDYGELTGALQTFPEDLQLTTIAVKYYLGQRRYREAQQQALRGMQMENSGVDLQFMYLSALEGMQNHEELQRVFTRLRNDHPDNVEIAKAYLIHCRHHGKFDALKALQAQLHSQADPDLQALAYFAAAELHWQQQDKQAMVAALKKALAIKPPSVNNAADQENIYRAAFLMAGADEIDAAINWYEKIIDHYQGKPLLLLNLSELYAAAKQQDKALAAALHARQLMPNWPPASECYGIRLLEEKEYAKAVEALTPLMNYPEPSERTVTNWTKAMEELIKWQFQEKQWQKCQNTCEKLLEQNQQNKIAREYIDKLKAMADKQ